MGLIIGNKLAIARTRKGSLLNPFGLLISGLATEQIDYTIPIYAHKGNRVGNVTNNDIFLNNACQPDFSDVYFEDASKIKLNHYKASSGNYEIRIDDNKSGECNWILPDGSILSSNVPTQPETSRFKLYKSLDNGNTWSLLYQSSFAIAMLWVDSRGYIFICAEGAPYLLKRSIDGGVTFSTVIDSSAVSGYYLPSSLSENGNGDLYAGRYQPTKNVCIFKSTDGGATWGIVYAETTNYHVHAVACDAVSGYVYAGIDSGASGGLILRSIDDGESWETVYTDVDANAIAIYCGDGFRLFGGEPIKGKSIIRTTDDNTFINVLPTHHTVCVIKKIATAIYALASTMSKNGYPLVLRSEDEGETWQTVRILNRDLLNFAGWKFQLSNEYNGMAIIGSRKDSPPYLTNYLGARIYNGGEHYQAVYFVKVGLLPTSGTYITAKFGGTEVSTLNTFTEPTISDLLVHYKLDEGTGGSYTPIIDVSGNSYGGFLYNADSTTWNAYNLKRAGAFYPFIKKAGSSLNFDAANSSYISILGSYPNAEFLLSKNFSVVMWVKIPAIDSIRTLVDFTNYASKGWQFRNGNNFTLEVHNGGSHVIYNSVNTNLPLRIDDMQEHQIGFIIDNEATPNIRFILNGFISTPLLMTTVIVPDDTRTMKLGYDVSGSPGAYYNGSMDDFRIYKHALTENEVQALYEMNNLK